MAFRVAGAIGETISGRAGFESAVPPRGTSPGTATTSRAISPPRGASGSSLTPV